MADSGKLSKPCRNDSPNTQRFDRMDNHPGKMDEHFDRTDIPPQ